MGYTIYKHTSPSGKVYIGQTKQPVLKRWANGHGYKLNQPFSNAIKKYGWDNIAHEILYEELTKEEANDIEVSLIAYYRSIEPGCYNITNGGDGWSGCKMSEAQKLHLSELAKGRQSYWKGKTLPSDVKKKISITLKSLYECGVIPKTFLGRKHTEETRRKMSEAHADVSGANNPMFGQTHTEETRRKISKSKKGQTHTEETRRKMSEAHKGQIAWNKGKKHSLDARKKMSRIRTQGIKITKNGINKLSLPEDLQKYLDGGWIQINI